ncbi:MAG: hypothetical protein ACR2KV_14665 [Solirubrobacteraceae bacterium]
MSPSLGLILWTLLIGLAFIGGCVTAAKGRWRWLLVGLLTGGLPLLVTTFISASPGSHWARFAGRDREAQPVSR